MSEPTFKTQLELQLWRAIAKSGMSMRRLARLSGAEICLLSNWVHGRRTLSTRVVDKIAQVLGLRLLPDPSRRPKRGKSVS